MEALPTEDRFTGHYFKVYALDSMIPLAPSTVAGACGGNAGRYQFGGTGPLYR